MRKDSFLSNYWYSNKSRVRHLHNCNLITKLNHTLTKLPITVGCCFFFSIFSSYDFLYPSSLVSTSLSFQCAARHSSKLQKIDIHDHKFSSIVISSFSLCYKHKMLFKIAKVKYPQKKINTDLSVIVLVVFLYLAITQVFPLYFKTHHATKNLFNTDNLLSKLIHVW